MAGTTVRPIEPTLPYLVTEVAGHVPRALNDLIGATTVSVKADDEEYRLRGAGARNGSTVEFHERELSSANTDPPVWRIVEQVDGRMVAEPPA